MTHDPASERIADWGRDRLAGVLDAVPTHTHDVGWGDGTAYLVGADPEEASRLEVFPEAGVVRITGQNIAITLFRQPPPSLYQDRVRFERVGSDEQLDLTLTRRGRLRLDITPPAAASDPASLSPVTAFSLATETVGPVGALPVAPEARTSDRPQTVENAPTSADEDSNSTPIPLDTETPVIDDSGGAGGQTDEPSRTPETPSDPTRERPPERVHLSGRIGRSPSFRTTRNGTLIASFPLAVRDADGTTTWHTVLAFGERAEKLREGIDKGQQVEVIGYLHQRDRTTRSGTRRQIDEVYATVITAR